jgi:hypothetical protein
MTPAERLFQGGFHRFDDGELTGKAGAGLLDDFVSVNPDTELAAPAGLEFGVLVQLFLDKRRHTGGAGQVVSNDAITNLDMGHGSNGSRKFQKYQKFGLLLDDELVREHHIEPGTEEYADRVTRTADNGLTETIERGIDEERRTGAIPKRLD